MKNETTSKRVANIAAKVLGMSRSELCDWINFGDGFRQARSLAGSVLTQKVATPAPKAKRKAK